MKSFPWFPFALAAMMLGTPPAYGSGSGRRRTRARGELTDRDREKIAAAKAKRERRAAKRLAGVKR